MKKSEDSSPSVDACENVARPTDRTGVVSHCEWNPRKRPDRVDDARLRYHSDKPSVEHEPEKTSPDESLKNVDN